MAQRGDYPVEGENATAKVQEQVRHVEWVKWANRHGSRTQALAATRTTPENSVLKVFLFSLQTLMGKYHFLLNFLLLFFFFSPIFSSVVLN